MLLFPACCHILLYLGVGAGCFSWSEAWGVSDLKMDSDTSNAQIAHKSCSTHAVFMLLKARHKSRLAYWIGALFLLFFFEFAAGRCPGFIFHSSLSLLCPLPVSLNPGMLWPKVWHRTGGDAFGWESAAVPAALGAPPRGFLSAKALWREQCLKLDCE